MREVNYRIQEPPFALPFDTIIHGKYRIDKVLGFGGFGITYQGEDLVNSGRVAIKEYFPSGMVTRIPGTTLVEVNSNFDYYMAGKEKFLREARIIYHCKNHHILRIYSLFEENNSAYYVMEFLEGRDLRHYIKERGGKVSWEELKPLFLQIMDALIAIHSEGVIHRDISPDNIYVSNNNTAKLIDFGTARSLNSNKSMSLVLKKGYAPPEQYQSRGKQGPWTDVYALGGTMFRALTGKMPTESIERVKNDSLKSPASYGVTLPYEVDAAIMKAMCINVDDRFQTIRDFKNAIDNQIEVDSKKDAFPKLFDNFTVWTSELHTLKEKILGKIGNPVTNVKPMLTGISGVYASQSFTVDKDIVIGRDPKICNIIFDKKTSGVSEVHCQICIDFNEYKVVVIDCDSSFGTFVNGIKISPGTPVPLNEGDTIRFGADNAFKIRF